MTRQDYRYDESGLDNVILVGLSTSVDDAGEEFIAIPNINDLHRVLVCSIAGKEGGMLPAELRFVRTEMGLTQAQLAELVGRDAQTVGRWERGENPIEQSAEMVIRIRSLQHVGADINVSMEDLAKRTMRMSVQPPIMVDAHDPSHYKIAA